MALRLKTDKNEYPVFGFSLSLFIHAAVISFAAIILNSSVDKIKSNAYVQIRTIRTPPAMNLQKPKEEIKNEQIPENKEELPVKEIIPEKEKTVQNSNEAFFFTLSDSLADTTNLVQVYKENTLNVTIKYPAGWIYIDQNVRDKLDGITFWTTETKYNPPPYIHVEVKDKDLFNPQRFQHKYVTRNYTAYYNDPEELAGQVNQIIYIRTNTDEDYSLKLIMDGEEAFKIFQPVFFGMVKSLKYGTRFF